MNSKTCKIGLCIVLPLVILLFPAPEGLSIKAWQLFAMYMAAIIGLILRPFDEAVILFGVIAASGLSFGNIGVLLSGYASSTAWLVFSAFMIGTAFIATGLGKRMAYILIGKFGSTTLRLGYVAALTDLVVAPATPSNTARTGGIIYPIFQNIAVVLGSTPGSTARRVGAYLTMTLYYISFTTGYTFLTAMAPNALILSFAESILHVKVDWMLWAKAAVVPGLVTLLIIPYAVYKLYPPELKEIDNKTVAENGLAELGAVSIREKILGVLFVLAILGWALGPFIGIDATSVAIGFVAACLWTGVMTWENILATKGAWSTFIWYGGIIGLADALAKAKFFEWLAKLISVNINFTGVNELIILILLVLFSVVVRYVFASMAAFVATMIPVLFTLGMVANLPVLPYVFLIAFAGGYAGMLTHYGGALSPVLFGSGYVDQKTWWKLGATMAFVSFVVNFIVSLPYWKVIGIW
ncbi:DASS family sodium-coupled anion symporter [Pelosinus propionicus]|uniref:Divalent anion:Na+ symporter, DASS family n=1 Tax=Pelosinus propionicus DSM 13327 TaxID=1123291 RepID=A0A1I4IZD4_9FIRM|nr:DASS family sodium-coupled anion symporter [Pelosinus propionicus]SFL59367.1 divalent anion:Na+ symporter, DASS family [Pelosinus propionicus DSM 13327]